MIDELNIDVNDILENDVSAEIEPDKFPCPEKYSFIVDFHTMIDNGCPKPPIRETIRKFQRKMDVLLGTGNSRFFIIEHIKRYNEIKTIPENIVVEETFALTLKKWGHFILEFNIDPDDSLLFAYLIKELIAFTDEYHCDIDIRYEDFDSFAYETDLTTIKKQLNIVLNGVRDVLVIKNNNSFSNLLDIFGLYAIFINKSKKTTIAILSVDEAYIRLSKLQQIQRHNRRRKILTEEGEAFI